MIENIVCAAASILFIIFFVALNIVKVKIGWSLVGPSSDKKEEVYYGNSD